MRAGNIFEGEWKEGKPQLKDNKSKGLADLLPWLNETVRFPRHPPLVWFAAPLTGLEACRRQVGSVPAPRRRGGGYESVMTDDPDGPH